ncbi:DUF3098 domain-containing protein [Pseudopedobacter beijingensis]|uniref:DUF3098 domain-containing protein n=1 Tax=Pseudopedobacter beijingensis TaxID=1207056 RepID=A0ABW4IBA7_9SPHI
MLEKNKNKVTFVFDKSNYQFLIISIITVIIGFLLMMGQTDIYSFRKIVLSPIIILIGFGIGFYAILKKNSLSK